MSKTYNNKIQFPADSDYIIRITDASHGPSKSSGNPLLTVEWEVVAPEQREIAGEMYTMAGIKSSGMNHLYFTTLNPEDAEKSANALDRLTGTGEQPGFLVKCFPDNPELLQSFNPENVSEDIIKGLKGKLLYVQMNGEAQFQRKTPTAAQVEEAKAKKQRPEGDIQTHPVTGAKLITYLPKVREIFGEAPASALKAGGSY